MEMLVKNFRKYPNTQIPKCANRNTAVGYLGIWVFCFALLPMNSFCIGEDVDIRRDATVAAVEKAMPSVVNIATETVVQVSDPLEEMFRDFFDRYYRRQPPGAQYSLGSGVIIDENGYILTNDHVVRRAKNIWVKIATGESEIYSARLVAADPKTDIAILKIESKQGQKFSAIKFAADDDLLLGETVLAMGNPFSLGGSVSRGILSSKSRIAPGESEHLDVPNWLQTDASINPGNSGGPLVNLRGELIGLNTAILREAQGIGFAVPAKRVSQAISEIFTPEALSSAISKATNLEAAQSLWFGARFKVVGSSLAVASVQTGSPADAAGLKTGDIVTQVNGKTARNLIELVEQIISRADVSLTVLRNNKLKNFNVHLVPESSYFNAQLISQKLGVNLQPLTPQKAESLGVNVTDAFIVASVDQNSPASKFLQPGYIVTAIDGKMPASLTDAAKIVAGKKRGERVQFLVQARERGFVYQGTAEIPVIQ